MMKIAGAAPDRAVVPTVKDINRFAVLFVNNNRAISNPPLSRQTSPSSKPEP